MFTIMSASDQTYKALRRQNLTCGITHAQFWVMEDRMVIQSITGGLNRQPEYPGSQNPPILYAPPLTQELTLTLRCLRTLVI